MRSIKLIGKNVTYYGRPLYISIKDLHLVVELDEEISLPFGPRTSMGTLVPTKKWTFHKVLGMIKSPNSDSVYNDLVVVQSDMDFFLEIVRKLTTACWSKFKPI